MKNKSPQLKIRWGFLILALGIVTYSVSWQLRSAQSKKNVSASEQLEETLDSASSEPIVPKDSLNSLNVVATPTPDSSARAVAALPPAPIALYDFLKKADPKANWTLTKNDRQKIVAIGGGVIVFPNQELNSKEAWVELLATWSGVPAEQLAKTEVALPETGFSRTLQYQQTYQGYDVDQGFIRLSERKADKALYFSQIELKDIGEPDLRIAFKADEAKSISLERFEDKKGVSIISAAEKPLIYVTQPGQSELVWRVVVKISGPLYDERSLIVSAKSGKVLVDVPSLLN